MFLYLKIKLILTLVEVRVGSFAQKQFDSMRLPIGAGEHEGTPAQAQGLVHTHSAIQHTF